MIYSGHKSSSATSDKFPVDTLINVGTDKVIIRVMRRMKSLPRYVLQPVSVWVFTSALCLWGDKMQRKVWRENKKMVDRLVKLSV